MLRVMSFLSVGWIPDTLLSGGREIFGVADEHAFREALGVLLRHSLISRKYQDTEGYCFHRLTALFALHHAIVPTHSPNKSALGH
ncbi:hypothetical protein AUP68_12084 [Ilyonectria robusta]